MIDFFLSYLPEKSSFLNLFSYLSTRTILSTLSALMIVLFFGDKFIEFIRSIQFNQKIDDRGPKSHKVKDGTPTMGGLLIIGSVLLSGLLWGDLQNKYLLISLFTIFSFGLIGFFDDYRKVKSMDSKGLSMVTKIFFQVIFAFIASSLLYYSANSTAETNYIVPFFKTVSLDLGIFFIFISVFIIVGSSNAVNLTDGLDGLAIVPTILVAGAFAIFAYVTGNANFAEYLNISHIPLTSELVIVCTAMVGAGLGFLWFNTYPAQVFMGDVGSLALGGTLGVLAVLVRQELVLIIMGGVFVMETLSVILQVGSYKLRGQRIFRMAPIHHHYELKGWPEPRVIVRFWIISIILVLVGLATLKLR